MDDQSSPPIVHGDLISKLPDDIICTILSYLFVDESARTSILSKRWRKLWLLSSINISDESIFNNSRTYSNQKGSYYGSDYFPWIMSTLSHILSTHPGPIHTCSFDLPFWPKNIHTLVGFLRILTQKGIRNLRIDCYYLVLPSFVLECETLVEVMLIGVDIPIQSTVCATFFPKVRKLSVELSDIECGPLLNLFASTPITEIRIMGSCGCTKSVVIKSNTLGKLEICDDSQVMEEVIIEDAPNLVCLDVHWFSSCHKIMISNAPKLKELRCIDMNRMMFQAGSCRFSFCQKRIKISGWKTYMHSLQSLTIAVNVNRQPKAIPYLLKCFPCLQTLIIKLQDFKLSASHLTYLSDKEEDEGANDNEDIVLQNDGTIACRTQIYFNHHMKHVKLENYKGKKMHMDFASLIVSEAKMLEKITLVYTTRSPFQELKSHDEEWIETHRQTLLQNRASKNLQVVFLKDNSESAYWFSQYG